MSDRTLKNGHIQVLIFIAVVLFLTSGVNAYQKSARIIVLPLNYGNTKCHIEVKRMPDGSMSDYVSISQCEGNSAYTKEVYLDPSINGLSTWVINEKVGDKYLIIFGYVWDREDGFIFLLLPIIVGFTIGLIVAVLLYLLINFFRKIITIKLRFRK